MARFELPVMNTSVSAPADSASSTAYWMSGLSTIGSISFGLALVTGRNRVPRPATGNTAGFYGFMWHREIIADFPEHAVGRISQSQRSLTIA